MGSNCHFQLFSLGNPVPLCDPTARATVESVGVVSLTNLHFFAGQAESESSTADRTE